MAATTTTTTTTTPITHVNQTAPVKPDVPVEPVAGGENVMVKTTAAKVPLPAEYVALGLTTGYNPCTAEEVRLYVTGLSGEGKSTFVASIPDAVTIDYERGVNGIPGRKGGYFNIYGTAKKTGRTAYDIHRSILDRLLQDGKAGKRKWNRIIFDTHDGWVELETTHLLEEKSSAARTYEDIGEYGQRGHGHSLLQGRLKNTLSELESVGYTWAIVGHLTYVQETDPITYKESTKIRPILSKGYVGPIIRKAELHLTINSTTSKEKTDLLVKGRTIKGGAENVVTRYYLFTRPTERKAMEGKQRGVPHLTACLEVPMVNGWDVLKKAYTEAVEKSKSEQMNS